MKTFTLALPDKPPHRAGQHYDIRLTAPDGYQAQRSYSIASEPERAGEIDLTVERIEEGEVSTYLHEVLVPGDQIEVRGPVGGYFVWEASLPDPLLLVAGGSGIVPLMAMIRHRCAAGSMVPTRLLYSSRTLEDIIYAQELDRLQAQPARAGSGLHPHPRPAPRLDGLFPPHRSRICCGMWPCRWAAASASYVCGPTQLVETAANALVSLGIPKRAHPHRALWPHGRPSLKGDAVDTESMDLNTAFDAGRQRGGGLARRKPSLPK